MVDPHSTGANRDSKTMRRHRDSTRPRRTRRRSRKRAILWAITGVVAFLVLIAAWVGVRAYLAKENLEAALPVAVKLKEAAKDGNKAAITRYSSELHRNVTSARDLTGDPIWRASEIIPFIGPNLTAVREVSAAVSELSTNAIGPMINLVSTVDFEDFKPSGGSIDLKPLIAAQPSVAQAATTLRSVDAALVKIDTSGTIPVVSGAVEKLKSEVQGLVQPVEAANNAIALLPSMLGSEGPRNYLLIFQNPAELRATGGIPGAMALIRTEGGRIELSQQASTSDFPRFTTPVLDLSTETLGLYGSLPGEYIQDVNLTPNFPVSARVLQKMWEERFGTTVDGVISIDPIALSYLLTSTGPVTTATGDSIGSENAVSLLLNEAYFRYKNPSVQDAFFASAAKSVFDKISSGEVDADKLLVALTKAGTERRILVWNDNAREQSILEDTTLSGDVTNNRASSPVGIFLNDSTGSKMDYYLDVKTAVGSAQCRTDGITTTQIEVTVSSNAPLDAASSLPAYITGDGAYGISPGHIKTMISVYGDNSMTNLGVSVDGASAAAHSATDGGRPVNQVSVELSPGESKTFTFGFLTPSGALTPQEIQTTPFINMNETSELALTCESALW